MLKIHIILQFMAPSYVVLGGYPEHGGSIFRRDVGTHQQH
jgi:hypothetical protein